MPPTADPAADARCTETAVSGDGPAGDRDRASIAGIRAADACCKIAAVCSNTAATDCHAAAVLHVSTANACSKRPAACRQRASGRWCVAHGELFTVYYSDTGLAGTALQSVRSDEVERDISPAVEAVRSWRHVDETLSRVMATASEVLTEIVLLVVDPVTAYVPPELIAKLPVEISQVSEAA
jgi:hypothetical protein